MVCVLSGIVTDLVQRKDEYGKANRKDKLEGKSLHQLESWTARVSAGLEH